MHGIFVRTHDHLITTRVRWSLFLLFYFSFVISVSLFMDIQKLWHNIAGVTLKPEWANSSCGSFPRSTQIIFLKTLLCLQYLQSWERQITIGSNAALSISWQNRKITAKKNTGCNWSKKVGMIPVNSPRCVDRRAVEIIFHVTQLVQRREQSTVNYFFYKLPPVKVIDLLDKNDSMLAYLAVWVTSDKPGSEEIWII